MKIACFTPLPPARTGIADYSKRLVTLLSRESVIHCFHDQNIVDRDWISQSLQCFPVSRYLELYAEHHYDLHLFQLGNSSHHAFMYPFLASTPGIIDLHDVNLHHFYAHVFSQDPHSQDLTGFLKNRYGAAGESLGFMTRAGLFHDSQSFLFPLGPECCAPHSACIVHSQYAEKEVRRLHREAQVSLIPPPCELPVMLHREERERRKLQLGWPTDRILICSFGEVLEKKGILELLASFSSIADDFPNAHLVFVGSIPEGYSSPLKRAPALASRIHCTGYASREIYTQYLSIADIGINLRFPSVGETSQTMLELFARGIPTIITDSHAGSEIPDDAVMKILPGTAGIPQLTAALRQLISQPETRLSLGLAARELIARDNDPLTITATYLTVLNERVSLQNRHSRIEEPAFTDHDPPILSKLSERYAEILARRLHLMGWQTSDHDSLRAMIQRMSSF